MPREEAFLGNRNGILGQLYPWRERANRTAFLQMRSLPLKRSGLRFQPSCFFRSEKKLRQRLLRKGFLEAGGQLPSTSAGLEM